MKKSKNFKQILCYSLSVLVLLFSSCKGDKEKDIFSDVEGLYINEIFPSNSGWIELYNSNNSSIDISGFIVQSNNGTRYVFPQGTSISGKSFFVINKGSDFQFDINAGGDKISLFDKSGAIIEEINMPSISGGKSYARTEDGKTGWGISDNPTKGSSNTPESEPVGLQLYINEVYSANPDWIELYNASNKEIDISGFVLQDDKGEAEEFIIPNGTKIAAKSYLVFNETVDFVFGLSSSNGDIVILLDKNREQIDEITIPVMSKGKSYGRATDGAKNWIIFDKPTKGLDNTTEMEDEPIDSESFINLILTEICGEHKYVEIYNKGSEEVALYGVVLERNEGASSYTFTTTDVIPAGAYRLILFNSHLTELEDNAAYVGWDVSSGISDQQTLSVQLINTADGSVISSFQRGVAPWGTAGAQREKAYSYSLQSDGSWGYAQYTPGAVNAVKEKEIVDPAYTAE